MLKSNGIYEKGVIGEMREGYDGEGNIDRPSDRDL